MAEVGTMRPSLEARKWRDARWIDPTIMAATVGIAFVLTALWVRSIHTFSVMPDELGYVKQAIAIARHGLPLTPGDFYFNSWGQLLPYLMSPLFGSLGMVDAFYAAHTLCALLLASTAIPVFLLAREIGLPRAAAHLSAALAVGVPWLALSGLIMTENVGYPAFAWAVLAMVRAVARPSARRDAVAIAAIVIAFAARTQFIVLGPILVMSVVVFEVRRPTPDVRRLAALRQAAVRHRVLAVIAAIALGGILIAVLTGAGRTVFGAYLTPVQGPLLPAGTFSAGFEQLECIVVAIAIVPAILALTWAATTVLRPASEADLAFAITGILVVAGLLVLDGSFQVSFLGGSTTERYLFYVAPLIGIAAMAWAAQRRGNWIGLALAAVLVGRLVMANGLHVGTASIINPSFAFHRVLAGQGQRLTGLVGSGLAGVPTLMAVVALVLALVAYFLRRWLVPTVAVLMIGLPMLAYQIVTATYVMRKVSAELAPITAAHPRELTWIDAALGADASVGLVLSRNGDEINTYYTWWQPAFWNKSVRHTFALPGQQGLAQGFVGVLTPDFRTGRLDGLSGSSDIVMQTTDLRFGLRARPRLRRGGFVVEPVTAEAALSFASRGVSDIGVLSPGARVRFFGAPGSRVRLELALTNFVPADGCPCRLIAVGRPDRPALEGTLRFTRRVTMPADGHLDLPLVVVGRAGRLVPGLALTSVDQVPG